MKKPNIFKYATSELSQDSILIWLLKWANSDYSNTDNKLHETAKYFLKSLINKAGKSVDNFDKINVIPQYHKIDVFVELVKKNWR